MRSGIVLAGANDVWVRTEKGDADDGVLTAQEVTQIDLRKNDLVVLSACETGLGDIKGSEGVYGLQRSLKMAGVKYIIMSLWQIPDKETVEFMGAFYKNLLSLKDIRGAFFEAQKEMRSKYDPYYWGAFVLME
jgi:CHAT domain-containing protein